MPVWTAVSYNPLSLQRTHRLQQILQEFQWYSFVGLQGTQRRTEHAVEQYTCGSHVLLEWGCQASDKAAGLALALRAKVFQQRNIVRVYTPPAAFQGRVGAVRVPRGDCDFCRIVAYVPVEPHTQSQRSYNERLWHGCGTCWIHSLADVCPYSCWMPTAGLAPSKVQQLAQCNHSDKTVMAHCYTIAVTSSYVCCQHVPPSWRHVFWVLWAK